MLARMSSKKKEEQYLLLQRIGRYKEAIDLAADRKDLDALEDIGSTLIDPTLVGYCNEKIGMLRRKWWYLIWRNLYLSKYKSFVVFLFDIVLLNQSFE